MEQAIELRAPRCEYCGDVIGVYEPVVCIVDGTVRQTSRGAEPDLGRRRDQSCYHAVCVQRLEVQRLAAAAG